MSPKPGLCLGFVDRTSIPCFAECRKAFDLPTRPSEYLQFAPPMTLVRPLACLLMHLRHAVLYRAEHLNCHAPQQCGRFEPSLDESLSQLRSFCRHLSYLS